jgi:hypothetical protein
MSISTLGCTVPSMPTLICNDPCIPSVKCDTPVIPTVECAEPCFPSCEPEIPSIPSCKPITPSIPSCDPVTPSIPSCPKCKSSSDTCSCETSSYTCTTCLASSTETCSCTKTATTCTTQSSRNSKSSMISKPMRYSLIKKICLNFEYTTCEARDHLLSVFRKLSPKLAKMDCKEYSFYQKKTCHWSSDLVDFYNTWSHDSCDKLDLTKLDSRRKLSYESEVTFISNGSCGPDHTSKGGIVMDVGENRYALLLSNKKIYVMRRTVLIDSSECGKGCNKRIVCNPPVTITNLDAIGKRGHCKWVGFRITWSAGKVRFYVDGEKVCTSRDCIYGPISVGFMIASSKDTNEVKSSLIPKIFKLRLFKGKC